MLKWLVLILVGVLGGLAVIFAAANQSEVWVTVPFGELSGGGQHAVPIFGLVYPPMLIGLLMGLLIGVSCRVGCCREMRRLGRLHRELEAELSNLRNLPLGD